jgi:methionine synthase I (cobalamin-dependent)
MDPQAFAAWGAAAAAAAGDGCVLGGCCGTTPEHIAALNAALLARNTS